MRKPFLSELLELYRAEYPPVDFFCLKMHDLTIKVRVNSLALSAALKRYFKYFLCAETKADLEITAVDAPPPDLSAFVFHKKQPEPGKSIVKEEYVDLQDGRIVRKLLTGMVFLFNGAENMAIGPSVANSNQVINFINNRFIERKLNDGLFLLHASGVCSESRGIALSGFAGRGKSTLALGLLNQGLSFVSNDRLMVEDGSPCPAMVGVAKYPRINPGTIMHNPRIKTILSREESAVYSALDDEALWRVEKKYDLFIEEIYGTGKFKIAAPLHTLFILNWRRKSGAKTAVTEIDLAGRADLYPAFIKAPGLFYLHRNPAGRPYCGTDVVKVLHKCRVFEITGELDFAYAEQKILDFLSQ